MRNTTNGIRTQVDFDNNRDLFARQQFPEASLSVNLPLSFLLFVPPPFVLSLLRVPFLPLTVPRWRTPPRWAFCPCWGWRWREVRLSNWNSTTLSVVGLRDALCYFVLFANASEHEVQLCLELVEGWQERLLMIYNLVVDTVVLLVYWNQHLSRRVCFHIVVAVGRVLPDWCQSWRCSRGT